MFLAPVVEQPVEAKVSQSQKSNIYSRIIAVTLVVAEVDIPPTRFFVLRENTLKRNTLLHFAST